MGTLILCSAASQMPIEAIESIEEYIPISSAMDSSFFLMVQGNSMRDAGIHNGDYVLVRNQSVAENGDIVVAKIPD
ncbi:S24 family peptidase [Paenibacillus sp. Y412MC10]|uniref:LexA family protein n=1 Tax=Geobacillus sp. (strain Y412MC10) TaxID=481743 RepID=UPI0011AB602E